MTTLVIRLAGPLQSWGLSSRFGERDTAREPTKSGVLGLLCAALGRDRAQPIADLARLRFGILVDKPGQILRDYHTALHVAAASGKGDDTVLSHRYYLADASFWAGLEGRRDLLEACHAALQAPRWPLFLGRKACPPAERIWLDDQPVDLELREAFAGVAFASTEGETRSRRAVLEAANGTGIRMDQPLSNFADRHFGPRRVLEELL